MFVSFGYICHINDLPPSRISHSSGDSPFIPLEPSAGENFSTAAIFFFILKIIFKHYGNVYA
jgi:hypothetical protein